MTKIKHWRYEDGWRHMISVMAEDPANPWEYSHWNVGWFCWVYPSIDEDFELYMRTLTSAECNHRFNSGDPMYTVHITDKNDAHRFAEKFNLKL